MVEDARTAAILLATISCDPEVGDVQVTSLAPAGESCPQVIKVWNTEPRKVRGALPRLHGRVSAIRTAIAAISNRRDRIARLHGRTARRRDLIRTAPDLTQHHSGLTQDRSTLTQHHSAHIRVRRVITAVHHPTGAHLHRAWDQVLRRTWDHQVGGLMEADGGAEISFIPPDSSRN
jgi:hypothetical protein